MHLTESECFFPRKLAWISNHLFAKQTTHKNLACTFRIYLMGFSRNPLHTQACHTTTGCSFHLAADISLWKVSDVHGGATVTQECDDDDDGEQDTLTAPYAKLLEGSVFRLGFQ